MRDNLREALNTQIDTWAQMGGIDSIDRDHVVNRIKEILAAHPDNCVPRNITTVEELDALAGESVIRDVSGIVYELDYVPSNPTKKWWITTGENHHHTNSMIELPATLLHDGGAS